MPEWTVTELLAGLKRSAQLPDANGALSDEDLLELSTNEIDTLLWPMVRKVREEHGVVSADQALVADQARYPIPWRAQIGVLRDVVFRPADGQRGIPLGQIALDDVGTYENYRNPTWDFPYAYAFEGDDLLLCPTPESSVTGNLRLRYYPRHGRLVQMSRAAKVASIASDVITIDAANTTFDSQTVFDFVDPKPPFRAVRSVTATYAAGGPTITTASTIDSGIAVGDYVTLEDESVVIQLPADFHAALKTAALIQVYDALGHDQKMALKEKTLMRQVKALLASAQPRAEGGAKKVVRSRSPLRRGRVGGRK